MQFFHVTTKMVLPWSKRTSTGDGLPRQKTSPPSRWDTEKGQQSCTLTKSIDAADICPNRLVSKHTDSDGALGSVYKNDLWVEEWLILCWIRIQPTCVAVLILSSVMRFRLDDRGGRSWVSLSPHVCKVVYLCFFFLFFFNVWFYECICYLCMIFEWQT